VPALADLRRTASRKIKLYSLADPRLVELKSWTAWADDWVKALVTLSLRAGRASDKY
jgi:hypothetical protein